MKVEYKDRGVLHTVVNKTKFKPHQSKNTLVRITSKALLGAETAVLFSKDLAVNRFVGKELHLKFERVKGKNGKYKTHVKFIRVEASQRPKGLLHKAFALDRFFEGDKPFQRKNKVRYKPKTKKGRIAYTVAAAPFRASKFVIKQNAKLTKATLLTGETAVMKAGSAGIRHFSRKLRNSSETQDTGKAVLVSITALKKLHGGKNHLINYRRQRRKYKNLKQNFKGQKLKNKAVKRNYKKQKNKIKSERKIQKNKLKNVKNKKQKIVVKSKIKYQKQLQKSEKKIVKNQKRAKKAAKKQLKKTKPHLIMTPAKQQAKQLTASAWQKAVVTNSDNDFMQAADKITRGAEAVSQATKAVNTKLRKKTEQIQKSRLNKQQNRLKKQNNSLKKNKRKHIKNNQKKVSQKAAKQVKKAAAKTAKAVADFTKFAFKLLGTLLVPILAILMCFVVISLIFTSCSGNSSYILGTYNAQDRYLAQAIEEYTRIAYEFNQNILKCGNSDEWKSGVEAFGEDTSGCDDTPNVYKFGRSDKFNAKPFYDFNEDKLAAFMCAYYYEPDEDGNVTNWEWNDSDCKEVIQKLFDTEYAFAWDYESFSGWKQYSTYTFYGGGGSSGHSYYTVYLDGMSDSRLKPRGIPNEIRAFCDTDGYIHYDYDTLEVLNANDNDERTGYFIQDQRYIITDPNGNQNYPFYSRKVVQKSMVERFFYDGMIHYRTYGSRCAILDSDGNETGFFITDISSQPYEYYRYVWKHGTDSNGNINYENRRKFLLPDSTKQMFCVVGNSDTVLWNSTLENICLISFYKKNYWYDQCTLWYTVKNKCTFDKAIETVLSGKDDNGEARLKFYYVLTQKNKNDRQTYGNHQIMDAPLGSKSLQKLIDDNKIYNYYGYDMQEWNKQHCGINECHKGVDFIADEDDKIYSMIDGTVNWINTDTKSVSIITSENVDFWYDQPEQREVEVIYSNIKFLSSLNEGDEIKMGQYIGKVSKRKRCFNDWDISASKNYLHIEVKVNYGNSVFTDWASVNPLFLMYRNDGETR